MERRAKETDTADNLKKKSPRMKLVTWICNQRSTSGKTMKASKGHLAQGKSNHSHKLKNIGMNLQSVFYNI